MIDSNQLTRRLGTLELAPFRIESIEARQALQSLVDAGAWGFLMPDAAHSGLAVRCDLVQAGPAHLLLHTEADIAAAWQPALASMPHERHVLRFQVRGLRLAEAEQWPPDLGQAAGDGRTGGTWLHCGYPPAIWRVPRRPLSRVAPPEQPPLRLLAQGAAGGASWQGDVIDLGIGGLAARVAAERPPCAVGDALPACSLSDGRYTSPPLDLRVCSVTANPASGHWRVGAALRNPSPDLISSLQLATYRFETEQRRQRLAHPADGASVKPAQRRVDRR
jgi:hypothetical protein